MACGTLSELEDIFLVGPIGENGWDLLEELLSVVSHTMKVYDEIGLERSGTPASTAKQQSQQQQSQQQQSQQQQQQMSDVYDTPRKEAMVIENHIVHLSPPPETPETHQSVLPRKIDVGLLFKKKNEDETDQKPVENVNPNKISDEMMDEGKAQSVTQQQQTVEAETSRRSARLKEIHHVTTTPARFLVSLTDLTPNRTNKIVDVSSGRTKSNRRRDFNDNNNI